MVSLNKKESNKKLRAQCLSKFARYKMTLSFMTIVILFLLVISHLTPTSRGSGSYNNPMIANLNSQDVDPKCRDLPNIKPSGVFFLNNKVKNVETDKDLVTPTFHIGSKYGDKVKYHMGTDVVHFKLIKELIERKNKSDGKSNTLAFDMGANQGFFTYFLAALGMDVHSFEISQDNFDSLQHGKHFNSKDIADRVHLYPMGLDNKISRFNLSGGDYGGFLKGGETDQGSILGVTFDCFAYHTTKKGNDNNLDLSDVAFVKLDVEGFEIAVLMGASKSLFLPKKNIGGMLMEVGPARWNRASIDFETGLMEMMKLSSKFQRSHVIIRAGGGHAKTCPSILADGILSDTNAKEVEGIAKIYQVKIDEWRPLLAKMEKNDFDCNFWYTNY